MKNAALVTVVVSALSACGGTTTPVTTPPPPATLTNPPNMIGNSYGDDMPTITQDGTLFGQFQYVPVVVSVINSKQLDVTINGTTTRLTATANGFVSADGNLSAMYAQGTDQIVFFGDQFDPISGVHNLGMFVDGNHTVTNSLPTSGTAVYSTGGVSTIDGTFTSGGSLNNGHIMLIADFTNGSIGGTMDGLLSAAPGTVFNLVPVALQGNAWSTTLTTNDPNVQVVVSNVLGYFFGSGGASVGGTVSLATSVGTAAGVFSSEP